MTQTEAIPQEVAPDAPPAPVNPLAEFAPEERAKIERLVIEGLDKVASGKMSFSDMLEAVVGERIPPAPVTPEVPSVPPITDEHKAALARIGDLYGKVVPTEPRLLTTEELTTLMEERETIDLIVKFLGSRKETSIREAVCNHLDRRAEELGLARREPLKETGPDGVEYVVQGATPTDARGHYILKHAEPAPGTGKKFSRETSHSKPKVTSAVIQKAYDAGVITRAEYLAMTEVPEVKRQLSEEKLRKSIKKDPGLLFRLADFAEPGTTSTSLYARNDT